MCVGPEPGQGQLPWMCLIASGIIAEARTGQCPPLHNLGEAVRFLKSGGDSFEPIGKIV